MAAAWMNLEVNQKPRGRSAPVAVGFLWMNGLPVNRRTPRRHSKGAANNDSADAGHDADKLIFDHIEVLLSKDKLVIYNSTNQR